MQELWMIRYGEIFLKSASVRERWEKTLVTNIQNVLPNCTVWRERGRIWLKGNVEPEQLNKIFGIVSFSKCTQFSLDQLHEICLEYCETHGIRQVDSFALRVRRIGNHAFTSQQIAQELGAIIQKQYTHLHVDLEEPEKEIFIEIRNDTCYLFDHVHRGLGGLPLGVEGTLVALISGGIDSPVAAWMMMKRGCKIIPLYVSLDGYLDAATLARTESVVTTLRVYQPKMDLIVVRDKYLAAAKDILCKEGQERLTVFCVSGEYIALQQKWQRSLELKALLPESHWDRSHLKPLIIRSC